MAKHSVTCILQEWASRLGEVKCLTKFTQTENGHMRGWKDTLS